MVALERVVGGLDREELLELFEVAAQRVDQLGLDRVLDDRVALLGDGLHVLARPAASSIAGQATFPGHGAVCPR